MSSPLHIIVTRPKPPVRRHQMPAGDGLGVILVSTLVIAVAFWRPRQKKVVAVPVPDGALLRVKTECSEDPFGYRATA